MHDFCFTYPYGFLVLFGGLFGFLRKGSTTSLMGGVGSGALLLLAAYKSHQDYLRGSKSSLALFLETGTDVFNCVLHVCFFEAFHPFMKSAACLMLFEDRHWDNIL